MLLSQREIPMYPSNDPSTRLPSDVARSGGGFLTYEPFYGLREKPFSLSADPRFLFRSPAHGPAFDALLAGIRRREGLIVLTGEIGTGKTTRSEEHTSELQSQFHIVCRLLL